MKEALRHVSNRKSAGWDTHRTSEGWRGGSGKSHDGFMYTAYGIRRNGRQTRRNRYTCQSTRNEISRYMGITERSH